MQQKEATQEVLKVIWDFAKFVPFGELVDIPIEKIENYIKSLFISLNQGELSTDFIKYTEDYNQASLRPE